MPCTLVQNYSFVVFELLITYYLTLYQEFYNYCMTVLKVLAHMHFTTLHYTVTLLCLLVSLI